MDHTHSMALLSTEVPVYDVRQREMCSHGHRSAFSNPVSISLSHYVKAAFASLLE